MKLQIVTLFASIFTASTASAARQKPTTLPSTSPVSPTHSAVGTPCSGNTANNRSTWCNYSINTDYENIAPHTGVTREYWLEVDEKTIAADGFSRPAMVVNGTLPGPTLFANWGDTMVIHVTNKLDQARNGSSIHWHGIRQNFTNSNDGVVSITQCPIAPGATMTYTWRAVQYGTSWYHSHIGLQAWEGVFGGIIINGPATANYQVDKGVLFLTDWTHQTVDELFVVQETLGPQSLTTGLINGTNVFGTGANATGHRFTTKVKAGTSYRLRLINAAIDTHWKFTIDNHTMTVIAMDLVPIKPFTTDVLSIGMAQRYDVIITANQASVADSFWIRAIPGAECSENDNADNIRGILYYGSRATTPRTNVTSFSNDCNDESPTSLVPWVPKNVEAPIWEENTGVTLVNNTTPQHFFRWELNHTSMKVFWENPTLKQIHNNVMKFTNSSGVIVLPGKNEWVYLLINTTLPVTHPIHLHGHDFLVLAQGTGLWNGSMHTQNPPRRDTAMLPADGFLMIAFETNNPGAWLMHCHIGWHVEEGFALQFIERYDEIDGLVDYSALQRNCKKWNAYDKKVDITQDDSGV